MRRLLNFKGSQRCTHRPRRDVELMCKCGRCDVCPTLHFVLEPLLLLLGRKRFLLW